MPEIISLSAEPRERVGKGAARAMRRAGRVPAIVYGDKKDPVLISLEPRELGRALARPGFFAHLIDLKLDGTTHRTLPRDVQYHPVTDAPLHIDFLRVGAAAQGAGRRAAGCGAGSRPRGRPWSRARVRTVVLSLRQAMRLIVGLGNPGPRYARNRHNIGFMAAEAIARRYGFPAFRDRFKGELSEGVIAGARRLLLRPQTFMNDSGDSVLAAMSFYKIAPEEIVVIHDELDLRPGKVRVKRGGGSAGHNGLRSIDAMIGPDYCRVRIGIGHPGIKELVHPYGLQNFTPGEARRIVMPLPDAPTETFPLLLEGAPDAFMSEVARRFTPPDLDAEEQA